MGTLAPQFGAIDCASCAPPPPPGSCSTSCAFFARILSPLPNQQNERFPIDCAKFANFSRWSVKFDDGRLRPIGHDRSECFAGEGTRNCIFHIIRTPKIPSWIVTVQKVSHFNVIRLNEPSSLLSTHAGHDFTHILFEQAAQIPFLEV